jgi:hypothetical protein
MDTLVRVAQSSGRGEAGRLTIGFYTSLSAGNLRARLLDFKQRFPQIELGTVEKSRARLITALRNGALDVTIVMGEAHLRDSNVLSLWSERILIALPAGHSLADQKTIYWTDLRSETVLLSQYDPGRELEDLLMSKLVSPDDRPKIERHDVSRGIIKSLVSVGFGVSLVTESAPSQSCPDCTTNMSGYDFRKGQLVGHSLRPAAMSLRQGMLKLQPDATDHAPAWVVLSETARIRHSAFSRGRLAARGARAASDAGDRTAQQPFARCRGKSVRSFKGIICVDISEFESYMPSHAVQSPATNM